MDATDVETGASGGTPAAVAEAPQPDVVTSAPAVDDDVTKPQQAVGSNDEYTVLTPLVFKFTYACLCLMCFMAGLDITIVVTAMPYIARQFNCLSQISWVVTAFLLAQTAMCPLVGRLSEIFGRKVIDLGEVFGRMTMLLFAVGTFTVFSLGCALSTNIAQLAVFRGLQGIGGGAIMSSVMIVITDITPARTRGLAIAPIGIMFALASIVGPLLGGALTGVSDNGWTYCFWINLPIGGLVLLALALLVPNNIGSHNARATSRRAVAGAASGGAASAAVSLDVVGSIACIGFVVAMTLALTWGGGVYAWSDARVIACLVVAGVALIFFLAWEVLYAAFPLIPVHLFVVRNFAVGNWKSFWSAFGMMASIVYLPEFFELVWGQSPTQAGISLIPLMVFMPVGAMLTGVSMGKTGRYYLQPLIGAALMIIGSALLTTLTYDTSLQQRVGFMIITGLSFGPGVVTPTQAAQAAVSPQDRTVTTSTVTFLGLLGRLLASAIGQTVLNNNLAAIGAGGGLLTTDQYTSAIAPVFWIGVAGGAIYGLGALCAEHIPLGGAKPAAKDAAAAVAEPAIVVTTDADANGAAPAAPAASGVDAAGAAPGAAGVDEAAA